MDQRPTGQKKVIKIGQYNVDVGDLIRDFPIIHFYITGVQREPAERMKRWSKATSNQQLARRKILRHGRTRTTGERRLKEKENQADTGAFCVFSAPMTTSDERNESFLIGRNLACTRLAGGRRQRECLQLLYHGIDVRTRSLGEVENSQ